MKSIPLYFLLLITISLINQSQAYKPNFIKKCCTKTSYPKICYSTFSPYSPQIKNNPKILATKALTVALYSARATSQALVQLSKHHGLRPKEASALTDCTMAVGNSAAQLQSSLEEMARGGSGSQKEMHASDVQTWISTALTYAGTCLECFSGSDMNGSVKVIVSRHVGRLTQFTSITLAFVNFSSSQG